jgi:hypothetical protein
MFTATFTFAKRAFDAEFHAMDQAIAEVARATPGYLGEKSWEIPANGLVATVYYWETLAVCQPLTGSLGPSQARSEPSPCP